MQARKRTHCNGTLEVLKMYDVQCESSREGPRWGGLWILLELLEESLQTSGAHYQRRPRSYNEKDILSEVYHLPVMSDMPTLMQTPVLWRARMPTIRRLREQIVQLGKRVYQHVEA
jgi:hypothetical protein